MNFESALLAASICSESAMGRSHRFAGRPSASGLIPSTDIVRAGRQVSNGRVEVGRGSLGPMANAPFPIPAHQTGRADFRHPAFRLASPQGTRRQTNRTRLRHGE